MPVADKRPRLASSKTLNARNLETLGAPRFALLKPGATPRERLYRRLLALTEPPRRQHGL